jgi:hypothetical protein
MWIKRTDGIDAATTAHGITSGCPDSGCNEAVRDRSVQADQSQDVYFQCNGATPMPGDTEITEAEYDAAHCALTIHNYENVFIPRKEKLVADAEVTFADSTDRRDRAAADGFLWEQQVRIADDRAELAKCKADVADTDGLSIRQRRNADARQ